MPTVRTVRLLSDPSDAMDRAEKSAARKRALADPEVRARMSAARKRALADPEVRARISAASKRAWAEIRAALSAYRGRRS